jgi:predicted metal-dependent phosphoesterase TrpH
MDLDLHVHTFYSLDSRNDPARVIEVARRRGLGGIAVCDHGTVEGARVVASLAPTDFLVIPGMEIGTTAGHLLALFIRETIRTRDPFEAVDAVHAQGGLVVLAHPFARGQKVGPDLARRVDACEAFNARYGPAERAVAPGGALPTVDLAREYGLALTSGSDAHFYWELGRGRTVVEAGSVEEVRSALLGRRTSIRPVKRSSILNRVCSGAVRFVRRGRIVSPSAASDTARG